MRLPVVRAKDTRDPARKHAEELQAQLDWLAGTHVHGETCAACEKIRREVARLFTLRPAAEYHEDFGTVLWWHLPICEPPVIGWGIDTATRSGGWLTHWSPLPDSNKLRITTEDLLG